MAHLPTLEAGTGVTAVLGRSAATMRYFDADLVSHEETFVILGNTLFSGLAVIKFLNGLWVKV